MKRSRLRDLTPFPVTPFPFLTLLEQREERDPGSVSAIYSELAEVVGFVETRQEYFDADVSIYGSFKKRAERIRRACGA